MMGWQRIRFRCPHRRANDAAIVNVLYTAGRKPIDLLFCRCAGYLLSRGQTIVWARRRAPAHAASPVPTVCTSHFPATAGRTNPRECRPGWAAEVGRVARQALAAWFCTSV